MFYVYQYTHPETLIPFYIGKGKNKRYLAHINSAERNSIRQTSCSNFCKRLLNQGLKPIITLLHENVTEKTALDIEMQLIKQYGRVGLDANGTLLNKSVGGPGNAGYKHSLKTKKHLSNIRTGNTHHSEKTRKIISEQTTKALSDPEKRKVISYTHKNKPKSEEHKLKLSKHLTEINRDLKINTKRNQTKIKNGTLYPSEETKLKISQLTKIAMNNPSTINKMKASSKSRWENESQKINLANKIAKTFKLTHKISGKSFMIKNLAQYCRDNKTYHRKVNLEYFVLSIK